jgi:hypothetical protein
VVTVARMIADESARIRRTVGRVKPLNVGSHRIILSTGQLVQLSRSVVCSVK